MIERWDPLGEKLAGAVGQVCNHYLEGYQKGSLPRQKRRGKLWAEVQVARLQSLMQKKIKDVLFRVAEGTCPEPEMKEVLKKESQGFDLLIDRITMLTAISIVYTFNMDFPLSEIREKYTPWEWIDETIEDIGKARRKVK